MRSLQEEFDAAIGGYPQTFKKPSLSEVLAWSEQWAHRLQLWGDPESEAPVLNESSSNRAFPGSLSLSRYLDQEIETAVENQAAVQSVQNNPMIRKEANTFIDNLLRRAGIFGDDIAKFKQVVPYKIACLHEAREPRQEIEMVPVWIYKRKIKSGEDLLKVFLNIKISLDELLEELHRIVHPGRPISRNSLSQSNWEYSLTKGIETVRTKENSGFLRTLSDWNKITSVVLSPAYSYDAVILFQRNDMHKPYQPAPSVKDSRDEGMAKLQDLGGNAEKYSKSETAATDPAGDSDSLNEFLLEIEAALADPALPDPGLQDSAQANDSHELNNRQDILETIQWEANNPETEAKIPQEPEDEKESISPMTKMLPHLLNKVYTVLDSDKGETDNRDVERTGNKKSGDDLSSTAINENEQSRYVSIWLDHDGITDDYFEYPEIEYPVIQPKPASPRTRSKGVWNKWYFQN